MWITRKNHLCILQENNAAWEEILNERRKFTDYLMRQIDQRDATIDTLVKRVDELLLENDELRKTRTIKNLILEKLKEILSKLTMIG